MDENPTAHKASTVAILAQGTNRGDALVAALFARAVQVLNTPLNVWRIVETVGVLEFELPVRSSCFWSA